METIKVSGVLEANAGRAAENDAAIKNADNKLKKVCCEFEQIFVKYLIGKMWSSVETIGGDFSRERVVWQDMLNNEVAKEISRNSGLGLSDIIYQQISEAYLSKAEENLE